MTRKFVGAHWIVPAVAALALFAAPAARAQQSPTDKPVFAPLLGWWSGEGRLGFKEGQTEIVKCRATYIAGETPDTIEQSIRCASPSGKIDVKASVAKKEDGTLEGQWHERVHNLGGAINGEITTRGFRVTVKGDALTAGMDIIVRDDRQIVEIQFFGSTLIGLTLLLRKGTAQQSSGGVTVTMR